MANAIPYRQGQPVPGTLGTPFHTHTSATNTRTPKRPVTLQATASPYLPPGIAPSTAGSTQETLADTPATPGLAGWAELLVLNPHNILRGTYCHQLHLLGWGNPDTEKVRNTWRLPSMWQP